MKQNNVSKRTKLQKCQIDGGDISKDDKMAIETMGMKKMMRISIDTKTTTTKYKLLSS